MLQEHNFFKLFTIFNFLSMKNEEEKVEMEVEKEYSVKETVAKLRRLAECLEKGEPFEIQVSGKRVYMPVVVEMSIEYENEESEYQLEFQFKWEK